ncbi:MAG: trypsin-like peptidase domain-containing protein [Candidatus Helarchaeota archaeon]|nr:trypsin-like peptidase domain-containing protein [Candidatus Helarchaeota archaeon]
MKRSLITKGLLSCVIALGFIPDKTKPPQIKGTGVIIGYNKIFFVVTARHVVEALSKYDTYYLLSNTKDGRIFFKEYKKFKEFTKQGWIFHPDSNVDLAVTIFGFNLDVEDIKVVPLELFAKENEIEIGAEAYVLGYPYGISTARSVVPIARHALIAGKSIDGHYYVDAVIFKGNSGGPVFLRPSIQSPSGAIVLGPARSAPKLVGIVSTVFYDDKQPLHLSQIVGAQKIIELFNSPKFKIAMIELKKKFPPQQ